MTENATCMQQTRPMTHRRNLGRGTRGGVPVVQSPCRRPVAYRSTLPTCPCCGRGLRVCLCFADVLRFVGLLAVACNREAVLESPLNRDAPSRSMVGVCAGMFSPVLPRWRTIRFSTRIPHLVSNYIFFLSPVIPYLDVAFPDLGSRPLGAGLDAVAPDVDSILHTGSAPIPVTRPLSGISHGLPHR